MSEAPARARVRFGGEQTPDGFRFELTGGALCLDLANTIDDRPVSPRELLQTYDDVLNWGVQAGALAAHERAALARSAARHPGRAQRALERVRSAREEVYRVFSAIAASRRAVPQEELAAINGALHDALRHRVIVRSDGGWTWRWNYGDTDLDRVLWPAVLSAAELLTSPDVDRVRECAAKSCAWLFVDTSRNRSRRWCDMTVCGNREKARRHRQKR